MLKHLKNNCHYIFFGISILLSISCADTGKIFIERDKYFNSKGQKISKIVSIAPSFYLVEQKKNAKPYKALNKSIEEQDDFEKSLKENAKLNKIDLQIISPDHLKDTDLDYFNLLKPLRDQIIISNIYQNPELSTGSIKSNFFKVPLKTFNQLPQISPDYNTLVEKYKTKYFAVNAVFSADGKFRANNLLWFLIVPPMSFQTNAATFYYTIIVDVEKSEIVYREIRYVDEKAFTTNLNGIIYDSYKIIKRKK